MAWVLRLSVAPFFGNVWLTPRRARFRALAKAMFRDAWEMRLVQAEDMTTRAKMELRKIDELLARVVDASNQSVVSAYERRVSALEREKALLRERPAKGAAAKTTWEGSFELAMRFLSRHWKVRRNSDLAPQKQCWDWRLWSPCRTAGIRDFQRRKWPILQGVR